MHNFTKDGLWSDFHIKSSSTHGSSLQSWHEDSQHGFISRTDYVVVISIRAQVQHGSLQLMIKRP